MALSRRSGARFQSSIWPGFVDAMTGLLLVLMFVLTIFMIVQFVLRETITGQASELNELTSEVAALAEALGLEQDRTSSLEDRVGTLQATLTDAAREAEEQSALIAALTAERDRQAADLAAATTRITDFEARVAALLADRDAARATVEDLRTEQAELLSQQEALDLALAQARDEIDAQTEAARLDAARREALEALVADLRSEEADGAAALETAQTQIDALEAQRLVDAAAAEALRARLENADAELTAMTLALEEQRAEAEETLTLLAAARAAQDDVTEALSDADERARLLALAQERLAEEEALSAESQREVEALNQQVAQLRSQMASLQTLLNMAAEDDAAAEVEIQNLGAQLNQALARAAAEERRRAELEARERERLAAEAQDLERYRSEFFGTLRARLEGREGIRVEGDRFVFSSEVLFPVGSASLSPDGRAQIARVAAILREISADIPPQIDWVIRVDGHTDNIPISRGGRYASNWELSQARALSVVLYMTEALGIPPERLAANGFGEFQPIDRGDTPEALARNRRIELKLTER
ncbi:peptidoglycan -binding protein [Aestuariibius sp. 2305UL40-4]|uniref:peptidoglycan -binding protein n=1 Tax=Aestuariibius violaceus TaxID=3234132 RepID=UPI00345E9FB3